MLTKIHLPALVPQEAPSIEKHESPLGFDRRLHPLICMNTGDFFFSAQTAADWVGCSRSTVAMHLTGKLRHCLGYTFRYASVEEIKTATEKISK